MTVGFYSANVLWCLNRRLNLWSKKFTQISLAKGKYISAHSKIC